MAGMYDGRFVFLFMNGEQVGQVAAAGTLRNVFAPIRIGATTPVSAFKGVIDEVWLSTNVVSKEELMALSCIRRPSTFAVNPAHGGPVPFDTPVNYQISVHEQRRRRGAAQSPYQLSSTSSGPETAALVQAADDGGIPPGAGGAAVPQGRPNRWPSRRRWFDGRWRLFRVGWHRSAGGPIGRDGGGPIFDGGGQVRSAKAVRLRLRLPMPAFGSSPTSRSSRSADARCLLGRRNGARTPSPDFIVCRSSSSTSARVSSSSTASCFSSWPSRPAASSAAAGSS